ncbi:MAG: hypothetical protein M1816_007349 [Peltula sp. TS41687]|nr:MAG: hypothetical protein M1816_007349 [Peltula sp. TS41687]
MRFPLILALITAATAVPNAVADADALAAAEIAARAVGDKCSYWDSIKGQVCESELKHQLVGRDRYELTLQQTVHGQCKDVGKCNSFWGFSVNDKCPHDPKSVKCCIDDYQCNDGNGGWGYCMNTGGAACHNARGHFISKKCPGPNDVKCCIIPVTPV